MVAGSSVAVSESEKPALHTGTAHQPRHDGLSVSQQERIERVVSLCRSEQGLDVSVLVGDLELADLSGFRTAAEKVHAALGDRAAGAVLVLVAPGQRRLEIVTGPAARRRVPDRVAALVSLSMITAFRGGDLAGGIVDGIRQLAQSAGKGKPLPPLPVEGGTELAVHH